MRRKLVKQGSSTLTVSLPAKWVRSNGLRAGQGVTVDVQENIVRILADPRAAGPRKIRRDVRGLSEPLVSDLLQTFYKKGFDEIDLHVDEDQVPVIQRLLQHALMGYEIVDSAPGRLKVRFVTRVDISELDALVRRLFLVTLNLAEGACRKERPYEYEVLEETNDRLSNYCENILIKHHASRPDAIFLFQFVNALERIGDEYRRILTTDPDDREGAKTCLRVLKSTYDLHYSYSHHAHDSVLSDLRASRKRLYKKDSIFASVLHVTQQLLEPLAALHA